MQSYQFVEVWLDRYLHFTSTDNQVADTLGTAIRSQVPTAEIMPSQRAFEYLVHKLQNQDHRLYRWTIGWLCYNGFEPFTVYQNIGNASGTHNPFVVYCFRRAIDG